MTNEWCMALLGVLMLAAERAGQAVSWLLDNSPKFMHWWEGLPPWAKKAIYASTTVAIGMLAWVFGNYVAGCADWPPLETAAWIILTAALTYLSGGYRHEKEQAQLLGDALLDIASAMGLDSDDVEVLDLLEIVEAVESMAQDARK